MLAILALDAALAGCSVGLIGEAGTVLAERSDPSGRTASLPLMVRDVLCDALGDAGVAPGLVAVTVGPGGFTGLRAALALAHGIALALGLPVAGVSVGEALEALAPPGRALWTAIDSKRGRIFLERGGAAASLALDALPQPAGPVAVAGDAAIAVASLLAARGADVQLLAARAPCPLGVALAALRRERAGLAARPAQPLYVDPPEARPGPARRPAPS